MVLESLTGPIGAEKKPWKMFFLGFLYSTVGVFLSLWIFRQYSSIVMVTLTVIACVPLMYKTMKFEEKKDMSISDEPKLLKEHARALYFLLYLFVGFIFSFVLWYVVLPASLVSTMFSAQIETITEINRGASGQFISEASNTFARIFINNIRVLMFCVFFAFFYGAGAIFILTWNASVISAAIGNFIKKYIGEIALAAGSANGFNYFAGFSFGLIRYMIHGIPEVAAYFIGGIAGGIISVAIINHDLESDKFKNIMLDSLDLTMLAIFILFVAAILEVFVTPLFF